MLNACGKIAEIHGLTVMDGGLKDINLRLGFELAVRVAIPLPDGSVFEPDKAMFEVLANQYGLETDDFGREFDDGSDRFCITGIEPRRPKYPINAERLSDRRKFKFAVEVVVMRLAASK
jgi:hypothetical protein